MCVVRGFRLIILETLGIEPGASRMLSGEVLPLHRVPPAVKVPLATTARCSGTASAATPLTENGAPQGDLQTTFPNRRLENSATGTRTRVARVRAEYPKQLD